MTFWIDGIEFKTKKDLLTYTRQIIHSCEVGERLNPPDTCFLLDLIGTYHRWADEKIGVGVKSFRVDRNPIYKKKCFILERVDETETDFSFYECIYQPKDWKKADFLNACRRAIADDIIRFKLHYFENNDNPICLKTGQPLTPRNSHVDHITPFSCLVTKWLEENQFDYNKIPISGYGDNRVEKKFTDREFKKDFQDFHRSHAQLRVISVTANLSRKKQYGIET